MYAKSGLPFGPNDPNQDPLRGNAVPPIPQILGAMGEVAASGAVGPPPTTFEMHAVDLADSPNGKPATKIEVTRFKTGETMDYEYLPD